MNSFLDVAWMLCISALVGLVAFEDELVKSGVFTRSPSFEGCVELRKVGETVDGCEKFNIKKLEESGESKE